MTISTEFLIYVALYRLTVLTVGALSIYWGFRLFTRSDDRGKGDSGTASSEVKAWKIRLSLTHFWPASFFTLFGTGVIAVMLWQGSPQVTLEDIKEATIRNASARGDGQSENTLSAVLDPCAPEPLTAEVQEELDREWEKLQHPGLTLAEASVHISHIARIHQGAGHLPAALVMARLASLYGSQEDRTARLILYAQLLEESGEMRQAVRVHRELVELKKSPEEAGGKE